MKNDYPQELLDQLSKKRTMGVQAIIYNSMKSDGPMTIDDILVAVLSRTKAVYKRTQVVGSINALIKSGKVRRIGPGYYQKQTREQAA